MDDTLQDAASSFDAPAMAEPWSRLDRHARMPTQSRGFHSALARTFLAGCNLELVTSGAGNEVDALAPMCRDPVWHGRLHLAGPREVSEPVDAICASRDAAQRLAEVLARQQQPIVLGRIPEDSLLVAALQKAMRGRALVVVRPAQPCPTIPLGPDWTEPEHHFNARRRSDFRRAQRRAEALGEVRFDFSCPDPAQFERSLAEAVEVEMSGWKRAAGTAIGSDPVKLAFFKHYLRGECEAGRLRIGTMRINGRAVAVQLATVWDARLWLFKIGYDETLGHCSPGNLLMLHTIGAAAREGLTSFELMGNAEPWIADLWTRDVRGCLQLRTYPFSLRGLMALASDGFRWLRVRIAHIGGAAR